MARIEGNRRDNDLRGSRRDDEIFGRGGDDTLRGRAGDDELVGGQGDDVFEFAEGFDRDTIRNFVIGEDRVDLQGFNFDDFEDIALRLDKDGDDVVLRLGGGDQLRFEDIRLRDLSSDDFF